MNETEMAPDQPFLHVIAGRADEGELTALTVALLVLAQCGPAAESGPPRPVPRWWRPERSRGFTPAMSWRAAA